MKRLGKVGLPVILLALASVGFAILRATAPEAVPVPVTERVWPVAVTEVEIGTAGGTIVATGEVVARSSVDMTTEVPGRIVEISPQLIEGGTVTAGDMLLVIDPFDYERAFEDATASLAEARARLSEIENDLAEAVELKEAATERWDLARRELARQRDLFGNAVGSERAVDQASLSENEARQTRISRTRAIDRLAARLDQQRAAVDRAEVALARAQRDLDDTRLVAPASGYLTDVNAGVGRRLTANDRVARLIDVDRLEIAFRLPGPDLASLIGDGATVDDLIGRPLKAIWTIGASRFLAEAEIARVGAELDPATGSLELFARFERPMEGGLIRPGAFVDLAIPDRRYDAVARLPSTSLFGGDTIYAVVEDRLEARAVTLVRDLGGEVLVRGAIEPGERVVTTRFPAIAPGLKVAVR